MSGARELGNIAHEGRDINPNMLLGWKREFLDKARTVFEDSAKAEKVAKREERRLKKEIQTEAEDHRVTDDGARFYSRLLLKKWTARVRT